MATETAEPTSLQTGTTPDPISSNAQDFSGSNDEFVDNFADDPKDDGTPMGLGGEKEKQSEPASSTLEADIVSGTKQPGEKKLPPEDSAGEPEPVQKPASETGPEISPEPDSTEPETPDFPPVLLQMAGYADAAAAKADGLGSPEALHAYIRGRGQLLTPGAQPAQPSEQGLYRRPAQQPSPPAPLAPETPAAPEETADVKPFQLSDEKMDLLDEDLQGVLRGMNEHYRQQAEGQQKQLQSLQTELTQREALLASQQEHDEEGQFDNAVQSLGDEWQDVFGEGGGGDLARAGQSDPAAMTNFNHRALLFETVQAVREVNAKQGYKPMALEQEVQWALMQRYPEKFQQAISGNSKGSGQRRGVTASRPTQRNTPPKGQNAKVLSDVNVMLKKKGRAPLDMGQEEEFEGEI